MGEQKKQLGVAIGSDGDIRPTFAGDQYGTFNTMHRMFFDLAAHNLLLAKHFTDVREENLAKHNELNEELIRTRDIDRLAPLMAPCFDTMVSVQSLIQRFATATVVFAALAAESFINFYGILKTSRSYYEQTLDKLDLVAKWLIIPQLYGDVALDRGAEPLQGLARLKRLRDRLVHFKAQDHSYRLGEAKSAHLEAWFEVDVAQAEDAIKAVERLANAIGDPDPELAPGWAKQQRLDQAEEASVAGRKSTVALIKHLFQIEARGAEFTFRT